MFLERKTLTEKLMEFDSFKRIIKSQKSKSLRKTFLISLGIILIVSFLPWTQNIQSIGVVSSISPNQRPQQINSIIPGRIAKWYIQDGQRVKKGDTLLQISEIKEDYLDESLLQRVDEQINAKNEAVSFYKQKAGTANQQENALINALGFKTDQLKNKLKQYTLTVQSESIAYVAAQNQFKISTEQQKRQQQLFDAGLKSLTELEQKQQYYQDALAKKISAENKYYNSKNELLNIKLELSAAEEDYSEKISKVNGERFTALSQVSSTEGEIAKLKNQFQNYKQRQSFYTIIAPQSGQVMQTVKAGLGETVKDGEKLMQIVPDDFEAAIKISISPFDMPLIALEQKVQLQFDGFPAIVFSGWPKASYGVFSGKVAAIDQSIDASGKFNIWVVPDGKKAWPKQLKYGAGTKSIALLKDVPLIYELWRQLNGFPPDYYQQSTNLDETKKDKK
ncbi:adhesin transport system membrane fusion protein [Pedobacter sp. CG_S7]|uniref:HlyD family secretion protein n=1 Tax=Pedobacter sp. CG_S7 TaxID=3143930 RepID=UPI003393C624